MAMMNFTNDKMPKRMPRIVQIPDHHKSMNGANMDLSKLKDNRFNGNLSKSQGQRQNQSQESLIGRKAELIEQKGLRVRKLKVVKLKPSRGIQ